MSEKSNEVVADTRCTEAEAKTVATRLRMTSNHLAAKPLPKMTFSRLAKPVRVRTKKMEPMKPPRMVMSCKGIGFWMMLTRA